MDNKVFEINEEDQEKIYAKMVIALFKSLFNESKITNTEYELLVREVNRTFNLS